MILNNLNTLNRVSLNRVSLNRVSLNRVSLKSKLIRLNNINSRYFSSEKPNNNKKLHETLQEIERHLSNISLFSGCGLFVSWVSLMMKN